VRWKEQQADEAVVRAALQLGGLEAVELVPPDAATPHPTCEYGEIRVAGQLIGRVRRHPTCWKVRGVGPRLGEAYDQHSRKDLSNALGCFLRDVLFVLDVVDASDGSLSRPQHMAFLGTVAYLAGRYSLQVREPVRLPSHGRQRRRPRS